MWKPIILFSSLFFHEWCLMAIPISDEISVAFVYVFVYFVFLKKKYLIFNFLSDTIYRHIWKKDKNARPRLLCICMSYVHITELKENDMKVTDMVSR